MSRSLSRCIRLGIKAEKIVLVYKAWGFTEDEALQRWVADLRKVAMDGGQIIGDDITADEISVARIVDGDVIRGN